MILWLQDNVEGAPTIIEAQSWREYLWGGRVAIYTGMPSVLGWRFHQSQQRTLNSMGTLVNQRRANINSFYETSSMQEAQDILEFYDIRYIIVGGLEKAYYAPAGLAKFDQMVDLGLLEKVYEQGENSVYRVLERTQVAQVVN
jgi:uncharacterized membrane protein